MFHYFVKKSFNEEPQRVDHPPTERGWTYGCDLTDAELDHVGEIYDLDKGILNDVKDRQELPRAEYSNGVLYVFIRSPKQSSRGKVISTPFLVVLKGSLLITLSSRKYIDPKDFFEQSTATMNSAKQMFLQLLSYVVYQHELLIHDTGKYVHNTAQRLRTHEVKNADFINFVSVEGDLNEYKTNLTSMQVLLNRLYENRHNLFTDKDCEYIEDTILLVNQLLVSTESHVQVIGSIRNAYTTMSNNILNQRMKTLTLLTLLVALPNVFYGMYGMNIALPFADEPWAYAVITGFTLLIVTVAYIIVRRTRF